jgi:hypothetical protein
MTVEQGAVAMRRSLGSMGLAAVAVLVLGGSAYADCPCPAASLDEQIAGSVVIFAGKPLMSAQIPRGNSPFHSEQTLETPGGVKNDMVTLFQVETMWKGAQVHRIKVRNDQGACSPQFKPDIPVIVFAVADPAGILWTRGCSGNATMGDARYESLKQDLTLRLRYD